MARDELIGTASKAIMQFHDAQRKAEKDAYDNFVGTSVQDAFAGSLDTETINSQDFKSKFKDPADYDKVVRARNQPQVSDQDVIGNLMQRINIDPYSLTRDDIVSAEGVSVSDKNKALEELQRNQEITSRPNYKAARELFDIDFKQQFGSGAMVDPEDQAKWLRIFHSYIVDKKMEPLDAVEKIRKDYTLQDNPPPAPSQEGNIITSPLLGGAGVGSDGFLARNVKGWAKQEASDFADFYQGFQRLGENTLIGMQYYSADFYHRLANIPGLLDKAASKISDYTGMAKPQAFQTAQAYLQQMSQDVAPSIEQVKDHQGLIDKLIQAIPQAAGQIGEVTTFGKGVDFPVYLAVNDALRESDKGAVDTALAAFKGYWGGKILDAAKYLDAGLRIPTVGGFFAGQSALEGQDIKDVAVSGLTGAGMAAMGGPGEVGLSEIAQNARDLGLEMRNGYYYAKGKYAPWAERGLALLSDIPAEDLRKMGYSEGLVLRAHPELISEAAKVRGAGSYAESKVETQPPVGDKIKLDDAFFKYFGNEEASSIVMKNPEMYSYKEGISFDEMAAKLNISSDDLARKLRNPETIQQTQPTKDYNDFLIKREEQAVLTRTTKQQRGQLIAAYNEFPVGKEFITALGEKISFVPPEGKSKEEYVHHFLTKFSPDKKKEFYSNRYLELVREIPDTIKNYNERILGEVNRQDRIYYTREFPGDSKTPHHVLVVSVDGKGNFVGWTHFEAKENYKQKLLKTEREAIDKRGLVDSEGNKVEINYGEYGDRKRRALFYLGNNALSGLQQSQGSPSKLVTSISQQPESVKHVVGEVEPPAIQLMPSLQALVDTGKLSQDDATQIHDIAKQNNWSNDTVEKFTTSAVEGLNIQNKDTASLEQMLVTAKIKEAVYKQNAEQYKQELTETQAQIERLSKLLKIEGGAPDPYEDVINKVNEKMQEWGNLKPEDMIRKAQEELALNLNRLNTDIDVKTLIAATAKTINEAEGISKETVTHEQTVQEAMKELPTIYSKVINIKRGKALTRQEQLAARILGTALFDTFNKIKIMGMANPSDTELYQKAQIQLAELGQYWSKVLASSSEMGRELEAQKIVAKVGEDIPATEEFQKILGMLQGQTEISPEQFYQLTGMLKTPDQLAEMAKEMARPVSNRIQSIFLEAWINGLLSNPQTHATNFLSNLYTAFASIPERYLASKTHVGATPGVVDGEAKAMLFGMQMEFRDALNAARKAWANEAGSFGKPATKVDNAQRKAISAENINRILGKFGVNPMNQTLSNAVDYIGKIWRLPTRALMTSDEFFKMINYRMELNTLAYRQAAMEGLAGDKAGARIAELIKSPTVEMRARAMVHADIQTFTGELGVVGSIKTSAPSRIQTCNLWLRRPTLYSVEL